MNSKNNDETNDFFGMEMLYDSVESGLNTNSFYNGNLSAVKWKGYGGGVDVAGQRSYHFSYDATDKLKKASFNQYGTSWSEETSTLDEKMTYDQNGNIVTLQRNQNLRGLSGYTPTSTAQMMDNLSYTYSLGGSASANQLGKVQDASGIGGGFADGTNTGDDYTYDSAGNVLSDQNKGIDSMKYNVIGKVQRIKFSDGRIINYSYDASGAKLRMATTKSSHTDTTDYVNGFVYKNDTLNFFSSPEGRVVNNGAGLEYQYSIADQQLNTRVVFSSVTPGSSTASAEFENWTAESSAFDHYSGYQSSNYAHTGTYSDILQGVGDDDQIAVAKSYHLYAGDKVELSGWYYSTGGRWTCCGTDLGQFARLLLGAFNLPGPSPGETNTASSAINAAGTEAALGYGNGSSDDTDARVFFNILVYDKNYNLINTIYQQVTDDNTWDHVDLNYTAPEEAYVFVYISNENYNWCEVYIDDVAITYTPSNIVQYNEYYPFGLQTAKSWTRAGAKQNNYLYNQGSELNATSGFYDLPYRNYDASVGRFFQVDPMAYASHNLTPYHYSGNNPIRSNDPSGALSEDPFLNELEGTAAVDGSWSSDDSGGGGGGGGGNSEGGQASFKVTAQSVSADGSVVQYTAETSDGFSYAITATLDDEGNVSSLSASNAGNPGISYSSEDDSGMAGSLNEAGAGVYQSGSGSVNFFGAPQAPSSGANVLGRELFAFDATMFAVDAHAEYQMARNAASEATTFFKSGLRASNATLKTIRVGATVLGKITFVAGAAVTLISLAQDPTLENAGWAVADIGVGAIGLFSGSIATGLATAGLAVPGLNLIIAGGALAYSGYRLYQAYSDGN